MLKKKLIEVALPLDMINACAAYEKMPGIGPHPRGVHLWWARRPFTVARAVIWASLVDDPSSHPELFPTEEAQKEERARLFRILEQLSNWKNSSNKDILENAQREIRKYVNNPPTLLDPFAGGGAIPLEGLRLGLNVKACDLNPIAVMINKSIIDIPNRFHLKKPVNPESQRLFEDGQSSVHCLAEDVRFYGGVLNKLAQKELGGNYPKVKVPVNQGGERRMLLPGSGQELLNAPIPHVDVICLLQAVLHLLKRKAEKHI